MKIVKKIFPLTLIILIAINFIVPLAASAAYKLPFEVKSKAAYLVNTDTDTVIYEKNAHEKIYPASLTKIMTAILALEAVPDLVNTKVTAAAYIFDELYGTGASTADIRPREEVRMIDLLYGLMLPSGCEAASIIADYVGEGNITEFVELMNKKAKELGAINTNFTNAHGLFDENQVSTAHDMYLITKYAMTLPKFEEISTAQNYLMPATNKHTEPYFVVHTNKMLSKVRGGDLYYYPHVRGIKTGRLPEVGNNLASVASLDGYNYMLITLGAPEKNEAGEALDNGSFLDAKELYNWAFSFFEQRNIMRGGDIVAEAKVSLSSEQDYVSLVAKEDVVALLPRGADPSTIQQVKTFEKNLIAPIKKDMVMGKVELKVNDEVIAQVDLVTAQEVPRSALLYGLDVTKRFFGQSIVRVLIVILILLIFTFMVLNARYKKLRRQRSARMRSQFRG